MDPRLRGDDGVWDDRSPLPVIPANAGTHGGARLVVARVAGEGLPWVPTFVGMTEWAAGRDDDEVQCADAPSAPMPVSARMRWAG